MLMTRPRRVADWPKGRTVGVGRGVAVALGVAVAAGVDIFVGAAVPPGVALADVGAAEAMVSVAVELVSTAADAGGTSFGRVAATTASTPLTPPKSTAANRIPV